VLHPAGTGELVAYEPRYLRLFGGLQASSAAAAAERAASGAAAGSSPRTGMFFGHILSAESAPPALLAEGAGGLPPVGVAARIVDLAPGGDGTLRVAYEGVRRFRVLAVQRESDGGATVAATWFDDEPPVAAPSGDGESAGGGAAAVDAEERALWAALQRVARLTDALAGGGGAGGLPESLVRVAPPPPVQRTTAEYLSDVGYAAGNDISTWRRFGGGGGGGPPARPPAADPYSALLERHAKARRQELFSFAAAQTLDLGPSQRASFRRRQAAAARLAAPAIAIAPAVAAGERAISRLAHSHTLGRAYSHPRAPAPQAWRCWARATRWSGCPGCAAWWRRTSKPCWRSRPSRARSAAAAAAAASRARRAERGAARCALARGAPPRLYSSSL